jgi:hypothetical protein
VLVRVLFQTAKHLFLAAKQWQFVPALWREVGPRQRGKGLPRSRSAQRGCRGTDACLSLCLRCGFMERLSPLWRGFFVRGRGHGNPQEFFGKRNFALLIVVYRSPFGIVRESVPSPGRLPPAPPLAGLFCASVSPALCNRLCGLALSRRACSLNPRGQALHTKPNLGPLRRVFCAPRRISDIETNGSAGR